MSTPKTYNAVFLQKFNNYFNRIIKKHNFLSEYVAAAEDYFVYSKGINFDFKDNVSTEIIMNDCDVDADYFLLLDGTNIVSRWFIIESNYTRAKQKRYVLRRDIIADFKDELAESPAFIQKAMLENSDPFIFNSEGMSFNQIKREETLLKDKTKCSWIVGYIAKNAAPSDVTITAGSVDFKATYLSDIATDMGISEASLASLLNFDNLQNQEALFNLDIRISYDYRWYFFADGNQVREAYPIFTNDLALLKSNQEETPLAGSAFYDSLFRITSEVSSEIAVLRDQIKNSFNSAIIANKNSIYNDLDNILGRVYLTLEQKAILEKYINNIIFYNGKYYKLNLVIKETNKISSTSREVYSTWLSLKTAIDQAYSNIESLYPGKVEFLSTGKIRLTTNNTVAYITMEEVSAEEGLIPSVTTKISSSRNKIISQNFDMFAIPFGSALIKASGGNYRANSLNAINIASAIARELDSACYDIQLLPYCPILDLMDSSGAIDVRNASENVDFNYINNSSGRIRDSEYVQCTGQADAGSGTGYAAVASVTVDEASSNILDEGYIRAAGAGFENATVTKTVIDASHTRLDFWAEVSNISAGNSITLYIWWEIAGTVHESIILWSKNNSFSVVLNYSLTNRDETKIESECNKYRLVSPNYQGAFDFNVAKNGGSVNYFIADCTYRPYTPYIKVAPEFNYLYGTNFGDCRGLICGGDYSLPRFTSAWETYELNNKNYQNIFNRDIQHLEFEQSLEMRQQLITGGLGVLSSGIAGAAIGGKVGGPVGAAVGAGAGLLTSGAGYAMDIDFMGQRHKEAKDYAIDKFNYQLGNIKALPYTLTKVSAFNINSKIWPFLEFYTCTEEEKEALRSKIKYESMTVMRIGLLGDYFSTDSERRYLKAELIRNETIAEDTHIFEAIYAELLKGVYI